MDEATDEIEDTFINLLTHHAFGGGERFLIEQNVAKSFQQAVNKRINDDIPKILGSFAIMFIYVSLSLGKLNCFENRVNIYFQ